MFIDEERGNVKVGSDGRELTRDNDIKKKAKVLQAYDNSVANATYDIEVSMIFLVFSFFLWIGSKYIERKGTFS